MNMPPDSHYRSLLTWFKSKPKPMQFTLIDLLISVVLIGIILAIIAARVTQ